MSNQYSSNPRPTPALDIGFVLPPGFQTMGLAALSVFELANATAKRPLYRLRLLSERGGAVPVSFRTTIETSALPQQALDTLVVCGPLMPVPTSAALVREIRTTSESVRRVASVCTGAFLLGEAGLLDDRHVTTHWAFARRLQRQFPRAHVAADRIFIADTPIWTSAGMSAGIDLALGMVEQDFGVDLAGKVAHALVVHPRRGAGQLQHALPGLESSSDRIRNALAYASAHLRATLTVEELAAVAHLSPRQFSRAFRAETGQSPAKAVEQLRVQSARSMVERSRSTMASIAAETGFTDPERMRRAFLRVLGQPPQAIRRNARRGTPATGS